MTAGVANLLQNQADAGRQLDTARESSKVAAKHKPAEDPRLKEAAAQFEAVLLRQMLTCLEKTTSLSAGGQSSGGSIYGSMVVNTVADAIARAGGLGLASLISKSVQGLALGATAAQDVGGLDSVHKSGSESADGQSRGKAVSARPAGVMPGEVPTQ